MGRFACAWYCAVLLWMSGTQHGANNYLFFGTILDYRIFSPPWTAVIGAILPWLHLLLAAVLVAPACRSKTPFFAVAALAAVFIMAQVTVLFRGIPVDCGCFGALAQRSVGVASMALAASLLGVALLGALLTPFSSAWSSRQCSIPQINTNAE